MTRYQAFRQVGCDPITSFFAALFNDIMQVPEGIAGIGFCVFEYEMKDKNEGNLK